ncbi:uncharacterized protein SPAPADRAFT_138437 [Spathaspora passalidarum NRRL Y-27907]|uniref:DASH complex subunit DAD1 n=1 Tax=Spathaspora passalidarum (strain NRRL Y-27907 / 11-Y1) TaxID=619300 RepID=G3ANX2_SPAPN|nr:uncharacterized protein SPAPADRAFT_138437 [Spathaspora passalidarum NRRL Y-27907]EGW32597.1 hypothetical protein SPAPADRAFT_138437 [Spathaspora passalidarum NRRL Y-27907]
MSRPTTSGNPLQPSTTSDFEKQRSLLIQQIANELSNLNTNIETLNRVFDQSLSIGKEFDDLGRLWSKFYAGVDELKQRREAQQRENVGPVTPGAIPPSE